MRGYLKSFLLIFILSGTGTAWAANIGEECNGTNKCVAGSYCGSVGEATQCIKCPDSHPNSAGGATSINQCYKSCGAAEDIKVNGVTLGTKTPNGSAYYNNNCTYTITCEQNLAQKSGDTCTGKCFTLTLRKKDIGTTNHKYLYFKYADGLYTNSECTGAKYNKNNTSIIPDIDPNTDWYKTFLGYYSNINGGTQYFDASGTPKNIGLQTFTSDTNLYGMWQENNCNLIHMIDDEQYEERRTCHYPSAGQAKPANYKCSAQDFPDKRFKSGQEIKNWKDTNNNKTYAFGAEITCDNSTPDITLYAQWGPCTGGYYCTDTGRIKCSAGATSDAGASQKTLCYISGATQFRDKQGTTFTLPIGNINYKLSTSH